MSDIITGILSVISFFFMVWYCVRGYNLVVGFAIMATVWTGLAPVGNTFSPNPAMEGQGVIDILTCIYTAGPAGYAKSILVNVFFGAFSGRVLVDSGIAATLIRKVVELGGGKPRTTMSLLYVVTAVVFVSMTGIRPVISIVVIVLPTLMSLGTSVPAALFSFMSSIMAGIFANIVSFKQYQAIHAGFNPVAESYIYNDYFQIGMIGIVVSLVVVLTAANISMNRKKRYAMAVNVPAKGDDAPMISWLAILLPVLGVILLDLPIVLGFILAGIWALLFTGKLRGGYKEICRQFAKLFTDGTVDVVPMVGFLMTLAMFNNLVAYTSSYFSAIFGDLIPQSPLVLAIVFAILTPLGFFRSPMNLVGSGSAILAVVLAVNPTIPPAFLFPLFAITMIALQHLDTTQSWVAWGLGYTKIASREYMKKSIPTGWIIGAILCLITFFLYGNA